MRFIFLSDGIRTQVVLAPLSLSANHGNHLKTQKKKYILYVYEIL